MMNENNHRGPYDLDLDKILIVDDLPLNRRLMMLMFHDTEFTISEAADGEEAIAKSQAELPFLVITDVQMPVMDGYGLCEAIKQSPKTANIAVIYVTAHHRSTEYLAKGLNLGGDDYIYRPFQREELLARTRAIARLKRAEVEAWRQAQVAERRNQDLTLLYQVGNALTSTLDTQQVLHKTTQLVQQFLGAEIASLWLLDESGQQLILTASSEEGSERLTGYTLPVDQGIAGHVARTGEPYFSADVEEDEKHHPTFDDASPYRPRSILCVPLRVAGRVTGVIQALHQQPQCFSISDLQLFESVTSSVSIAVENARLFEEVRIFNQQLERMVIERTRQLEQEKERTWGILANMADALVVIDHNQNILIANVVAEDLLNFRLADMIGRPIPPDFLDNTLWRSLDAMARSPEQRSSAAVDLPNPVRPEEILSIQSRSSKILGESGQRDTVVVLRDITALKEVERMKAQFMAGVTHELKTPLAVIRTHANNLTTYYRRLPDRKRKELIAAIEKQAHILERLVGEILDVARLDAGSTLQKQRLDVGQIVDQVITELRPLVEQKRLNLRWKKPPKPLFVSADLNRLERVVRNLVDNAIKYTPAGVIEVEVRTVLADGRPQIHLQVIDTGIGIPAEQLSRIFERFYRVDPAHTIPGAGLGLAIVKEIVEAHGGEIQVSSTPGKGSTFEVILPGIVT
ncbi:MAG TPA: ATP-binding protein [Anaerolineae bacterium]|nr:ATP-binding protein [Anaerolineae bacterium]